nr:MetQ/NlpA family ABC transporter substrate-binding protein [Pseudoclavibacter sp. Marseille-Q3772]
MRKRFAILAATAAAALALSGCAASGGEEVSNPGGEAELVIGASPVPHAQILEYVRDNLAEDEGLKITIKEFDDYVLPNQTLNDGELDANYFQHLPYLESEMKEKGYEFEHGEGVHIEPLRLFSSKVKSPDEIKDGATIAITNDVSNQARGLLLLQEAGLLKDITTESSVLELTAEQNPKNLQFEETQPEVVVQLVDDPKIDAALVNANFVFSAGLNPEEAILSESVDGSPYANVLVWKKGNDDPNVKKLEELLHSQEVKDYIKETWPNGDVVAG